MHKTESAGRFNCVYEKKGYIGFLTVFGVMTPGCNQELNMRLKDSIMDADFVVVNLDQVTRFDSDCYSLLCIVARMAYNENKRLYLGRATSEQQIAAVQMCSLNDSKAAQHDCAKHCFWLYHTPLDGKDAIRDMRVS